MVHENLNGRVAVITGGGGVLCSGFAKDLAAQGVKVAILDLREDAAKKVADEINAAGGTALAVGCNVLESESLEAAREKINAELGSCDILINGAGGNSPLGTTTKDTLELEDIAHKAEGVKTFFDLDPKGIEFVFNLNFLGTLLTTQCFAKDMVEKENATILNISSMNAYRPLTRIPHIPRQRRLSRTSPSSWPCILPMSTSESTPLRPDFSRLIRTKPCSSTRTARSPRVRTR